MHGRSDAHQSLLPRFNQNEILPQKIQSRIQYVEAHAMSIGQCSMAYCVHPSYLSSLAAGFSSAAPD